MKVFVTIYDHKHGTDVNVFSTKELATQHRIDIADEWWVMEYPNKPKPTDPEEMVDAYFDNHATEWFEFAECIVDEGEL